MRDDHYRQLVSNPSSYDKVIDWIKTNNPYAAKLDWEADTRFQSAEEFSSAVVNDCISRVIFGEPIEAWAATGMCIAIRQSSNPSSPGYKKVVLAIQL